jgi:hypothetical protein
MRSFILCLIAVFLGVGVHAQEKKEATASLYVFKKKTWTVASLEPVQPRKQSAAPILLFEPLVKEPRFSQYQWLKGFQKQIQECVRLRAQHDYYNIASYYPPTYSTTGLQSEF